MAKDEDFKILTAKVVSVSEHLGAAYTIEIKTKSFIGYKDGSLTIDPRCTFYKDDKQPKAIDIIRPGDTIEATYILHKGIKVALNIIVKPR